MRALVAMVLSAVTAAAYGGDAMVPDAARSASAAEEAQIRSMLEARLPEAKIEAVHRSAVAGLFEVVFPTEIAYTDEHADVLFLGHLIDTRTRTDLGSQRWNELHNVPFANLPLELAIKTVKGDGHRRMAVFADPECPFCQQLEQNLAKVSNVTVYTFLFPLESVHPGAGALAHAIWCASDRSGAWTQWMLERREPASEHCPDDPVPAVQQLATKLDVSMTPTLFFSGGQRMAGAQTAENLEHALNGEPRNSRP
jgi:thiol:disulfide interchange protein DsbC